jgi:hypothetical protein
VSEDEDNRTFSLEDLDNMVPEILLIKAWVAAVENRIQASLEAGAKMKNACLIPKRGTRAWIRDEKFVAQEINEALEAAGKTWGEDIVTPRVLLTPAGAEKLVGKARFAAVLSQLTAIRSSGEYNLKLGNVE